MSPYTSRTKSLPARGSDEFRIEFEEDVIPPPTSRHSQALPNPDEEDDFASQLQRTQEELLHLRHQARAVERRKEELEEITRKEREYSLGRAELHEKLSSMLVTLDRLAMESQRQMEIVLQSRDDMSRHYRAVSSLADIADWSAPGVSEQADHALAVIADARGEYERISSRVSACVPDSAERERTAPAPVIVQDFRYWFRSGLAFTLPLVILGALALLLHHLF